MKILVMTKYQLWVKNVLRFKYGISNKNKIVMTFFEK